MKIAILNSDSVATSTALKAIANATLSDQQFKYISGESITYIYFANATSGDYRPDDGGGYWVKDITAKGSLFFVVADAYDFNANSATDITSVSTLEAALESKLLDYRIFRESLRTFVESVGFANLSAADKKTAAIHFVVSKTDRDSVLTTAEQDTAAAILYEKAANTDAESKKVNAGLILSEFTPDDVDGFVADPSNSGLNLNLFEERIFADGKIIQIINWTSSSKTKKVSQEDISYNGTQMSQVTTTIFNADGTVKSKLTETLTYSGGKVSSVSRVKNKE